MAITIKSPKFSFVRFDNEVLQKTCNPLAIDYHLPVAYYDDISFQFFVETGTKDEATALFDLGNNLVTVGIAKGCDDDLLVNYRTALGLKPERARLSDKQILYTWPHGFPLFDAHIGMEECFVVKVDVNGTAACSNTFQRIAEDCYTAVLEYGSTQNIFDFNYCMAGETDTGGEPEPVPACEPTIVQFQNVEKIDYFYSPAMRQKYGDIPTVKFWFLDEATGKYYSPVIDVRFNAVPPTRILADLGGPATGYFKIS